MSGRAVKLSKYSTQLLNKYIGWFIFWVHNRLKIFVISWLMTTLLLLEGYHLWYYRVSVLISILWWDGPPIRQKTNAVQILDASFLVFVDNCYLIKIKELQDEKKLIWQSVDKSRRVINLILCLSSSNLLSVHCTLMSFW